MKAILCESCGASDFYQKDGLRICAYCGTKHQITGDDLTPHSFGVAMSDDVLRLLQKCREEPYNARRYANLILDIDPNNKEAMKYL